jgi:hypothetical protein
MPPDIRFDHSSIYFNTGLMPAGPFQVGNTTDITISLLNDGDQAGSVDVKLFFSGPTAGSPGGTQLDIVPQLVPPDHEHIWFDVDPGVGGSKTVQWTPQASDFPSSLGTSVHGCLFAQTVVDPLAPAYDGDDSALGNWDPHYKLCAQHNIDVVTVAASPSPKPVMYAFGVGHGLGKAIKAELLVEKIAGDDPGFLKFLQPMRETWKMPKTGRTLTAADLGLTLGVEHLLVRKTSGKAKAAGPRSRLQLGHSGLLEKTVAAQLAEGKRAKSLKLPLAPGELRQAIVDITPPKGAKRGDVFAVGVANQIVPVSAKQRRRLLGTLTLIVRVT